MQLVERHIIVGNKEIEYICSKAKNLYNQSLYYLRQSVFGKIKPFKEYELTGLFAEFNDESYRALPAQTSQQIIKLMFKNYKSWYKARKEWMKNPSKFNARPKLPKYKKTSSVVIFTDQQLKLKDGYIYFPKDVISPLKTKVDNVCQVRIIPQATCFIIEVIYEKKEVQHDVKEENVLSIDLGLNNLIAATNNIGKTPFIINGKPIKSNNQFYNKTKAILMSYIGDKGTSNRIKKITFKRNNYIEDKLHKISRFIVDYCVENKIGTIIIGHNKEWKQKINIGKSNNQKFVLIPHSRLIDKIAYKSLLVGIKVKENEESYTSKCDSLALEPVEKQEVYLGKRAKRGLFLSSIGKSINADINGSINTARKVVGDCFAKSIINSGLAFNPIKINIF